MNFKMNKAQLGVYKFKRDSDSNSITDSVQDELQIVAYYNKITRNVF